MVPTVALLLVSLLAPAGARTQQSPTPSETTSTAQTSMPDLGQGAEEVAAHLRQLTGSLSDTASFAALEAEVAADTQRAAERWSETDDLLKTLSGTTLTPEKQKLVDQAKTFYADFDFLDAYRLALAASH